MLSSGSCGVGGGGALSMKVKRSERAVYFSVPSSVQAEGWSFTSTLLYVRHLEQVLNEALYLPHN